MKNSFLYFVIVMVTMLFAGNLSHAQEFTTNGWEKENGGKFDTHKFADVYRAALKLNANRFKDLNKIQVGDTILFPARNIYDSPEYWVADAPQLHDGRHDCIWLLTERYMNYELPTQPAVIVLPPVEPDPIPVTEEKAERPAWVWLMLALMLIAMILLIIFIIRNSIKYNQNPDNHQPVMRGGLSNDPLIAADQIARISEVRPNNVLRTERVILVRDSGPDQLRVEMEFGDGIKRNVDIKSGEAYVLATLKTTGENTIQELYRSHCGNKTGPVISSGRINTLNRDENGNIILPSGWRFVKEAEYIRPATEEIVTEITESSAATPIPAPAVTPAPISELETIITAIGKVMPKGGKKFNLEYEIGGKKSKIKLEME